MKGGRLKVHNASAQLTDWKVQQLVTFALDELEITGDGIAVIVDDRRPLKGNTRSTCYRAQRVPARIGAWQPAKSRFAIHVRVGLYDTTEERHDSVIHQIAACAKSIQDYYDGMPAWNTPRMEAYAKAMSACFQKARLEREKQRETAWRAAAAATDRSRRSSLAA